VDYETEEQQIEAIKKWFREYGMTIVTGLVLGLVGIFGYRYFVEKHELQMAETSDAYESVVTLLNQQNNNEKFLAAASKFKTENPDTIYSNLLSFQLAKLAVDASDLATAEQHLSDILDSPQHATIEHIARIRLARVILGQGDTDKALTVIADAVGDEFRGAYEMLRGDIWMAKGDRNRARQAYSTAKEKAADGPVNPNLEMLLTDLADETASVEPK